MSEFKTDNLTAVERMDRAIEVASAEIRKAEARLAHKLETGEATPEQAARSRRVTLGRMQARVDFLEREREQWLVDHPEQS